MSVSLSIYLCVRRKKRTGVIKLLYRFSAADVAVVSMRTYLTAKCHVNHKQSSKHSIIVYNYNFAEHIRACLRCCS